ncbi:IclR family transcriptional regulator [Amycolatopsis nigrescens]|uniref:IclR family transcriptional regulator n=1 Tax=Amycolatopsis nigrescens TaxID=381445 RepID=UPI0003794AD6|nr:helix-turn-helix domain-containing protein [Amycolatopsis nigrescens]
MTGSPPTERVVGIVELLAGHPAGCSVAEVAARLNLNRSTTTAVLAELEAAGWVRRLPGRDYVLGPGLLGVAEAVRVRNGAVTGEVTGRLAALAAEVGCGVALTLAERRHLTYLACESGPGRLPAGIEVGTRLPLRPPAGAAVMAWREDAEQRAWLAGAPARDRPPLRELLALVRAGGTAVWRLEPGAAGLLEVLGDVVELLDEHPARHRLRTRVLTQLAQVTGRAYTADELAADEPLPISYLVTPVFDATGTARYELQLGPLAQSVDKPRRDTLTQALTTAAANLRHL